MKRFLYIIEMIVAFLPMYATNNFSAYKGVWSSNDAEAVLTDSICIFYCKVDSTMQATLEVPVAGISSKTVFAKDGAVTTSANSEALAISLDNGVLNICGHLLKKVEDIKTVKPYEPMQCKSKDDVGDCLQLWRLGAKYGQTDDITYCEINTNRHMFVYMTKPSMAYIRAAAARNNNHGTLFVQNIRMMKNHNTGEYTMYIAPDNYNMSRNDLEIDNTKFQPNSCFFNPDGGIYWSLIQFEPDLILLNGCGGETYRIKRPQTESDMEYFEYVPYQQK